MSKDERPSVWIGHVSLPTPDVKSMSDFMVQIGMRFIVAGDEFAVLELRGGTHLVLSSSDEPISDTTYFDLMVEDLDESHRRLRDLHYSPSEIEPGKIHSSFTVTAPSGHVIKFNSSHVSDMPV
jgi:hypothetical protein